MPFHHFYCITRGKKGPIISTFPALLLQNLHTATPAPASVLSISELANIVPSHLCVHSPSLDSKGVWFLQSSCNRLKLLFFPFCEDFFLFCEDLSPLHKIPMHPVVALSQNKSLQRQKHPVQQGLPHAAQPLPCSWTGPICPLAGYPGRDTTRTKQRMLWSPESCSQPSLEIMEKGQVGPWCGTAAGGRAGAPRGGSTLTGGSMLKG